MHFYSCPYCVFGLKSLSSLKWYTVNELNIKIECDIAYFYAGKIFNCVLLHLETSDFEETSPWFKCFTKK